MISMDTFHGAGLQAPHSTTSFDDADATATPFRAPGGLDREVPAHVAPSASSSSSASASASPGISSSARTSRCNEVPLGSRSEQTVRLIVGRVNDLKRQYISDYKSHLDRRTKRALRNAQRALEQHRWGLLGDDDDDMGGDADEAEDHAEVSPDSVKSRLMQHLMDPINRRFLDRAIMLHLQGNDSACKSEMDRYCRAVVLATTVSTGLLSARNIGPRWLTWAIEKASLLLFASLLPFSKQSSSPTAHQRRNSSSLSSSAASSSFDRSPSCSPPRSPTRRAAHSPTTKPPPSPSLSGASSQPLGSTSPIPSLSPHTHSHSLSPPPSLSLSGQLTSGSFLVSVGAGFIAKVCSDIFYGYFDLDEPDSWAEIAKRGAGHSLLNWMAFSVASSESQVATFVVGALLTMLAANFDGPPAPAASDRFARGGGGDDAARHSLLNHVSHRLKNLPSGVWRWLNPSRHYDTDNVDVPEALTCQLCLGLLRDPATVCGHIYCHRCITQHFRTTPTKSRGPLRNPGTSFDIQRVAEVEQLVNLYATEAGLREVGGGE